MKKIDKEEFILFLDNLQGQELVNELGKPIKMLTEGKGKHRFSWEGPLGGMRGIDEFGVDLYLETYHATNGSLNVEDYASREDGTPFYQEAVMVPLLRMFTQLSPDQKKLLELELRIQKLELNYKLEESVKIAEN